MAIDHTDPEVLDRLYNGQGMDMQDIADRSNVTQPTIAYHFGKHDIDTRNTADVLREKAASEPAVYRTDARGYERWYSQSNDGQVCVGVSRLLAACEYGVDALDGDIHVHHKNGVPWDNRPENIELIEQSEHIRQHNMGERSASSKLTEQDVVNIKLELDDGSKTYSEIGNMYGVSDQTIYDINSGRTWDHIPDNVEALEDRISQLEQQT